MVQVAPVVPVVPVVPVAPVAPVAVPIVPVWVPVPGASAPDPPLMDEFRKS